MKKLLFILLAALAACTNVTPPAQDAFICKSIHMEPDVQQYFDQAVGQTTAFWKPGQTLRVGFLQSNATREAYFKQACIDWSRYANLKFDFVTVPPYDIRVAFDSNDGSWSYIGKNTPSSGATLNLGWNGYDVAAHELGHALGLLHEQQNPEQPICWNRDNVIKDLSGPPNNWSVATIEHNVLNRHNPASVTTSPFDGASIMLYTIPARWTCNGQGYSGGKIISKADSAFVATVYPFPAAPPPPVVSTKTKIQKHLTTARAALDSVDVLVKTLK